MYKLMMKWQIAFISFSFGLLHPCFIASTASFIVHRCTTSCVKCPGPTSITDISHLLLRGFFEWRLIFHNQHSTVKEAKGNKLLIFLLTIGWLLEHFLFLILFCSYFTRIFVSIQLSYPTSLPSLAISYKLFYSLFSSLFVSL